MRQRPQELKFVSASTNDDGKRVTLSVNQLCKKFNLDKARFVKGKKVVLRIEGVESFWYVNRDQSTLTTKGFPARLEKPYIGEPANYVVSPKIIELGG